MENEDDEPSNYSSDNNDDISSEGLYSASCSEQSRTKQRKKRMTSFELSELIVRKGMKSRTELLAYANDQKLIGKSDIAEFIVNRAPRVVSEVLATAWEMTNAQAKLDRSKKTRIEILEEAAQGQCTSGCNGEWFICASEVLEQNGIRREAFTTAIRELLEKGRSKFCNIMICGPANSGKTFLLNPLTSIYDTFSNPASTPFAWVGAEDAECIFLTTFAGRNKLYNGMIFILCLKDK